MGLDDREQRILAEIERRFYEEDPDLADAVRNISRRVYSPSRSRLAALGAVVGLAILLWTFTINTWIAVAGFILLVVSASTLVQHLRARSNRTDGSGRGLGNVLGVRFRKMGPFEQE